MTSALLQTRSSTCAIASGGYQRYDASRKGGCEDCQLDRRDYARAFLCRISALFAVDAILRRLLRLVAAVLFGARIANLLAHFGAAWLTRRIGLVNNHGLHPHPREPSPDGRRLRPHLPLAAALFLLREYLVEMDVPTRLSYVMAVVAPDERTVASGITNLVRLAGWATGAGADRAGDGPAMDHIALGALLLLGAGIKIGYDLLLYAAFRRHVGGTSLDLPRRRRRDHPRYER